MHLLVLVSPALRLRADRHLGVVAKCRLPPKIFGSAGFGVSRDGAGDHGAGVVDGDPGARPAGRPGAERGSLDQRRDRFPAGWPGARAVVGWVVVAHAMPSFLIRSRLLANMRSTAFSVMSRCSAISAWVLSAAISSIARYRRGSLTARIPRRM